MKKVFLLLVAVCLVLLPVGCSKKPDNSGDNKTEDVTVTPTEAPTNVPEKTPTPTETVPDNRITLTLSQILDKINGGNVIMYVLEGTPEETTQVASVLAFKDGKVTVYNSDTVTEALPANLLAGSETFSDEELLSRLDEAYQKRVSFAIGEIVKKNEEAAALYALSLTGSEAGEWTGRDYFSTCKDWYVCVDAPAAYEYYTFVYTDASGKNLLQEKLIVPQVWGTDELITRNGEIMAGQSIVFDYKKAEAPAIPGYDSDTLAAADAEMWLNEYKNAIVSIREDESASAQGNVQVALRDALTIDAKKPLYGKIANRDYIGYATENGGSVILLCEPDTASAADTAETIQGKASYIVNPDYTKEAQLRYDINRSLLSSAEPFWEKESVKTYLKDYVTKELAYRFIENKRTDLGCYVLECLGFADEAEQVRAEKDNEPEERDLGGMTLVLGNWWDDGSTEPFSEADKIIYDYQQEVMRKNNFSVVKKCDYTWGDQAESCILSIVSDEPLADILMFDYRFIGSFMNAEKPMFADLSKLTEFDFSDEKWNKQVTECMTIGNSIYGFSLTKDPTTGVYWNKDLVEMLLGPGKGDCLYDWQASGEWTWDKFKEFAKECTVDRDFDGMTDIYGLTAFQAYFFEMAIISNGHQFVTKGDRGLYSNHTNSKDIIDDCNWAYSFYTECLATSSASHTNWDYFLDEFMNQKAVMLVYDSYYAEQLMYNMQALENEHQPGGFHFGFVCFPKGPKASGYSTCVRDNIQVIPNCTDTMERLSNIAYAFNVYTDTPEELEDEKDYWKAPYYNYLDTRAVDETLDLMLNKNNRVMPYAYIVPNLWDNNNGLLLSGYMYSADGSITPQVGLEAQNFYVQQEVDAFNETLK